MFMAQVLAGNIIIIQDNRPDITITVRGCFNDNGGVSPQHAALCQHTQNTSATLVSVFSVYRLTY